MVMNRIMNKFGFVSKDLNESPCCDVQIKDGQIIGTAYSEFGSSKKTLSKSQLDFAYEKVSCIGTAVDTISNNMQMIEPVFFDDEERKMVETLNLKLKKVRNVLKKPNAIDNRKSFIDKAVKSYVLYGAIYFAFVMSGKDIISIKIIDNKSINYISSIENDRIDTYTLTNAGTYNGQYTFNGSYYVNENNKNIILAPFINAATDCQYLPASPLEGTGLETLLYWYGCFHNKSLLENGAKPSIVLLIKSLLQPKHREQLREEIKIRHGGASNAGSAIIIDGAADKDLKLVGQNNKDMDFVSLMQKAESAIYKRLGVNWILDSNVSAKDFKIGMEMLFDLTICPFFQSFYNHIFDVFKYYNSDFNNMSIFYLEQDIPALRDRYLGMMSKLPQLGIFTINERRAEYNYPPLDDERGDELVVNSVSVFQQGMSPDKTNTTTFGSGNESGNKEENQE